MEIHFLGVGEACDPNHPNTSILLSRTVTATGPVLLDCGFSVPHRYLSMGPSPDDLETLWLSHFHGDHFLGTPLLLLWFWEMNRSRPLNIIGPAGVRSKVEEALELAYPGLMERFKYPLLFHEIGADGKVNIADFHWSGAYNEHSQPCLSLRLDFKGRAIFYSGDGRPTPDTRSLAEGCDIIIHEAYGLEDTTPGHGSIRSCLDFARAAGVARLVLLHMQRNVRLQANETLSSYRKEYADIEIILPETGDSITL